MTRTGDYPSTFAELNPPYSVIVVDPPWPLAKFLRRRARPNQGAALDYATMTLDEIAALPVADLAADVSTLFLWTIDKYLHVTRPILEGWGFSYHLTMTWDKGNGSSLMVFNRRTEFCLVGLSGNHERLPARPTIRTGFSAPSRGHSQKPDLFFDMLGVLEGPRVELFARAPRLGWDSWGHGYELPKVAS